MASDDHKQFLSTFFDEAADHVRTLEARLLELEANPSDSELLNALFRAAHSVKGASSMLGFETLAALTHAMENVLEALRGFRLRSSPLVASTLLDATDLLAECLHAASTGEKAPDIAALVSRLEALTGTAATVVAHPVGLPDATPRAARPVVVTFRPPPDVFAQGLDPGLCVRELLELGTGHATLLADALPSLASLDPEQCHLGWRIELTTTASQQQLRDVFMFVADPVELSFSEPGAKPTALPSAPRATGAGDKRTTDHATLRVNTSKVDRLINLVGELVIAQAMVSRSLANFTTEELPRLREAALEMERHTRELQDGVMNIRMVPIGSIFGRFRRLVRDVAETLNKDIALDVVGEGTELDKSMVEALADPLTHLVRNSADHGLETAAERVAAGKPPQGTIRLSARHQGGNVLVEVSDDGKGLDTERIRARAVERGLISEGAALSPEEIHQLIFAPGFSTAAQVSDLSGRGVGMDVVLRSVEALKGSVTISTERGRGSKFVLTLPLTLAILDGMALRVGRSTFVLPLSQVVETLPFTAAHLRHLPNGGKVLSVRGQTLPLLRLSELLALPEDQNNPHPLVVLCEAPELTYALTVDELLGQGQFVIKSLETNYRRMEGVLGATILGDGTVSFILDVQALATLGRLRPARLAHGREAA